MSINDIPTLSTEALIDMASTYDAAVKQYRTKQMKNELRHIAGLCRAEVAKR